MAEKYGGMYARVGRADAPVIYEQKDAQDVEIGKGMVVEDGADATIIVCGTMVEPALNAHEELLKQGVQLRVVDMHTVKPLDAKLVLKCVRETNALVTAEEHSIIGGLGSAVAETLAEKGTAIKFMRMGIRDEFCESGEPRDLLEKYQLNQKHMVKNVQRLLKI
jgi:transketolase